MYAACNLTTPWEIFELLIENGADLNHTTKDGSNVVSSLLRSGRKDFNQVVISLLRVPRNRGGLDWRTLKPKELERLTPLIVELSYERQKLWIKLDHNLKTIKQVSSLGKLPRFLFREWMRYNY